MFPNIKLMSSYSTIARIRLTLLAIWFCLWRGPLLPKTRNYRTPPARLCNWPTSGRMSCATWQSGASIFRASIESDSITLKAISGLCDSRLEFAELMKFEVDRTRALFAAGRDIVGRVPGKLAVDIDLFSRGGIAVLDRIEAQGFDVLGSRPALTRGTKLALLLRALAMSWLSRLAGSRFGSRRATSCREPNSPRWEGRM